MQFIKPDINIDFTGKMIKAFTFSLTLILIGIISLVVHHGPNYGIDFAGGTLIQVKFTKNVPIKNIRTGLNELGLGKAAVQTFGPKENNEFIIRASRLATGNSKLSKSVDDVLTKTTGTSLEIRRIEMVGPQVGKELRKKALLAMFYSLLFITIYISGRFELKWMLSGVMAGSLMVAVYFLSILNMSMPILIAGALVLTLILFWFLKLKFAMGAIVALIHDVTITVGVFSVLNLQFSLPIIAALLTIIGYSLNDTIIVFDRIRENMKNKKKMPFTEIINRSINETLSRTILTSSTTLFVLFALFFLGGEIIHNFAFAMIVGVVIGTYSSIFIASPILLAWKDR